MFHSADFAPACCNRNFYANSELDTLLDKAIATTNQQERRTFYEKAQEILWRDQAWVWIFTVNHSAVGNRAVTGVKLLPTELIHFRDASVSR